MNSSENVSSKNRLAVILLIAAAAAACILMALPFYTFTASVYTKKSSNTFVGDEKYKEVRAEVEAVADEYRSQGMDARISETVTERTNSKGKTTSLVAFSIEEKFTKNIWSFFTVDIPSSHVLRIMVVLMGLSILLAILGCAGSMDVDYRDLSAMPKRCRSLSALLFTADIFLTPVYIFMNNYCFWRKLDLYNNELITDGKEAYFAQIDAGIFGGEMGGNIDTVLKNLKADHSPLIWLLMLCFLIGALAAAELRYGAVKRAFLRGILYTFMLIVCVVILYPYYVMFITAFRSNAETLDITFQHLLPTKWVWSNLKDIVDRGVLEYLMNSVMIAGGATLLAMLCGIPAAFAMARMNFKGKKAFLGFVIVSQMFSPVVLLIGISQLMNTLHLNDTILGLIFVNAAFNQAFAIWLLRGTFASISPEMEQAARIDGCTTMGSLTKVLLPMAAPGIVTTLIFVFINSWNEYTISTVLISTASKRPITVGITQFSSFNMIEWQYLFAASLLATIPVVILFMTIEKHLTSGLTSGGVKG